MSDTSSGDIHGRPTAAELVDATIVYLRDQLSPDLEGPARHQVRIAVHALEMVLRELTSRHHDEDAHRARLASLGCESDAELAATIRSGTRADTPELRRILREATKDRLLVANPRWLPDQS